MASFISEDVYKAFLTEMQALEDLRVTYTSVHAQAALEREDPEVRRLIEALALFAARNRVTAQQTLLATQQRLFRQFFSFLLSPCPATALLQMQPTGRLADVITYPKGTEVALAGERGARALFATERDLVVLPIKLEAIDTLLRPKSGTRVVLSFRAPFPRNDAIGLLPLHVNHLDDYAASLTVLHRLRRHLERAVVVFGEKPDEDATGDSCEVTFGEPVDDPTAEDLDHPLQRARSFFHFPQRDLFLNVRIGSTPRNWTRFHICLELDGAWPRSLRLNRDMFQPFTVPITNLRRAQAAPIMADGRESRHRIRHPTPAEGWSLHSVRGVFSVVKNGLVPLQSGMITSGGGSYEIERTVDADGEAHWLRLRFPDAFDKPRKITVDARWIQPAFSAAAEGRVQPTLHGRVATGVQLEVRGVVRPHADNPLRDDFEGMLQILALRSKATGLTLEELRVLIGALGAVEQGSYRPVVDHLGELSVTTMPEPRELGGGRRNAYKLALASFDVTLLPLIDAGLRRLHSVLVAWTPDAHVHLDAQLPGDGAGVLTYR